MIATVEDVESAILDKMKETLPDLPGDFYSDNSIVLVIKPSEWFVGESRDILVSGWVFIDGGEYIPKIVIHRSTKSGWEVYREITIPFRFSDYRACIYQANKFAEMISDKFED